MQFVDDLGHRDPAQLCGLRYVGQMRLLARGEEEDGDQRQHDHGAGDHRDEQFDQA